MWAVHRRTARSHPYLQLSKRALCVNTPDVTLFQYEVCPYCCGAKAFFHYHGVPYNSVEVNPLTKKDIKSHPLLKNDYKKVPIALVNEEQVNGSQDIVAHVLKSYGTGRLSDSKDCADSVEWAHEKLVKLFPMNLYRTLPDAWEAFEYITKHKEISGLQRHAVRVVGTAMMWGLNERIKKKYGVKDERAELLKELGQWMEEVQTRGGRQGYHGGSTPNAADLWVYGMLTAMRGMKTLSLVLEEVPHLRSWYDRMGATVDQNRSVVSKSTEEGE